MNDEECLKYITNGLRFAVNDLRSARSFILKRKNDYYHDCDGFDRLVHQVENLYSQYYNQYCKAVKRRVIDNEH